MECYDPDTDTWSRGDPNDLLAGVGWAWLSPWNPAGSRLTSRTVPVEPLLFPEREKEKKVGSRLLSFLYKKKKKNQGQMKRLHGCKLRGLQNGRAGTPQCSNHGVKEKKARVGTREPARAVPGCQRACPGGGPREGRAPQREALHTRYPKTRPGSPTSTRHLPVGRKQVLGTG